MSDNSENSRRIAKNTIMLYFRQIITMGVSLYTSRVVLSALGVEDFGIYNVVGGLVGMFAILSSSLSSAISRFITYELGKGNKERLKAIFSTSINVQIIISVIIVAVLELVGVWFLNNKLDIPPDRLDAAGVVLHISMLTFLVSLISVPYNATIIAHEKMSAFAYVSLLEVFLKLGVVMILSIVSYDKLVVYAWLLFGVALIIQAIYGVYCNRNFSECKYHFVLDKPLLKEMFTFAGWNFIGASSGVLKIQGVNMVLNIFFGPVVNAARGIAMQVNAATNSFVTNFMVAMNPQLTKSYASGDLDYTIKLVHKGAKYSYYLLLIISLPILFETGLILSLWLTEVPDYTIIFVRLILIDTLITSLSNPLITVQLATGNIKTYQIVVGGIQMMNLPLSYLCLNSGCSAEYTLYVAISLSIMCLFARLYFLQRLISLSIIEFIRVVVFRVGIVSVMAIIVPLFLCCFYQDSILRAVLTVVIGAATLSLIIYFFGIDNDEKRFVNSKISGFKLFKA